MVVLDGGVVGSRCTEVIALHTALLRIVEATSREDRLRKGVRLILILPQVRVTIPHRSILHSAIGLSTIGVFGDDTFHIRSRVFVGTEQGERQPLDGLPLQLQLELDILDTKVDVVIIELVLDIEGSVVTRIELIRVERTARVESIGEGVDIEAT